MLKTMSRFVLGLALLTAPALMLGCGEEAPKPAEAPAGGAPAAPIAPAAPTAPADAPKAK